MAGVRSTDERPLNPLTAVGRLHGHSFLALQRGAHVVDLGSYEGEFARRLYDAYTAEVIGCEPHPVLAESIRAKTIPGLTVCEVAIAAETGSSRFYAYDPTGDRSGRLASGASSSTGAPTILDEEAAPTTVVRTMTFDDFLQSEVTSRWGTKPIDLLKVDIEAAEIPLFLDTPAAILERFRQITVEFHDFADAGLNPDVMRARQRLRTLGFHELRFTLNKEDVLFINERFFKAGHITRLALIFHYRIIRGISRRMHRRLRGGEPTDDVPAPHKIG